MLGCGVTCYHRPVYDCAAVVDGPGLYMFDYLTGDQEMPADLMETQLQVALTLLHAGRVHDVIFLGSPIVRADSMWHELAAILSSRVPGIQRR